MAINYISGNTYPVKDRLRQLGCRWDATRKAWYTDDAEIAAQARALVTPHPAYNSPPPVDLGTADPVALAAQHGRQAVEGAKVLSFSAYGLAKGDDGAPNGTIRMVRGKRYVQVARTPRRYLSRDWLEDMDLFDAEPGGSYQWDGVEVIATDAEAAADAEKTAAKAAKEAKDKRRTEILNLVQTSANYAPSASTRGLVRLWGTGRMAGSEWMYGDAERLVYATSSYDDAGHLWELRDAALAAEAAGLKTE